jgi:hypothetical protein
MLIDLSPMGVDICMQILILQHQGLVRLLQRLNFGFQLQLRSLESCFVINDLRELSIAGQGVMHMARQT